MRKIIHIQLTDSYPDFYYKGIVEMLKRHFENVNKDTYKLKDGVFLKSNREELLIYEEEG